MRTAVLGSGHYVPPRVVTNDDLGRMFATSDAWIQQRTGIRERRFIEREGIGPSHLALPAARAALGQAGCPASEVDCIVFATLSPDYTFPGSGVLLQQALGLPGVTALDVRAQCSGFLYALSVGDAWIRSGSYRRVLVVGSEVQSTALDLTDRGRDVSVLFGDGAGAVVLGPTDQTDTGILSVVLGADGAGARDLWMEAPTSRFMPRISSAMLAEGRHFTRMNGKHVFRWASEKMPETAQEALRRARLSVDDVDLFIPHQANLRISQLVAERLGIPDEKVFSNIQRYGNTTAASIPICVSEASREGRLGSGSTVLLAAFGAGYTWGASVVRF